MLTGPRLRNLLLVLTLLPVGCAQSEAADRTAASNAVVRAWKPNDYPKDEVNLILMGDWGAGFSQQRMVAKTLTEYVADAGIQFHGLLSLGDNFYVNLRETDDKSWATLFEQMYDPARLNFPFYAALGNHDYEHTKEYVEQAYTKRYPESRWRLPARWYRLDMPEDKPLVTVLMLDSNKPQLSRADWREQMKFIGAELAKPRTSKWLIVCAHHPLYTNGSHGDNRTLQLEWGPLLEKYKVDFYVAGHDHDLQHLQPFNKTVTHIVSGGGGKKPRPMSRNDRGPFSRALNGFVHLRLTNDHATARFIDSPGGKTAHLFQRLPDGTVQVLGTTGREAPTTKPATRPRDFEENDKEERVQ
jgi:tartrate-resistant acid phosphatase type 5